MNTVNITNQQPHKSKKTVIFLKGIMIFIGISGCFSVLCGAWLAHGGQALPDNIQSSMVTALQYQLFHTIALLTCLVWIKTSKSSVVLMSACIAFIIGILCFSGTIYIKAFFELTFLGKLTPFGGIALALAWLLLALESKNNF
ncbi:MAG: DUF423 domain-containing protein [Colwellia sp.]|nr:DUF423 domain-containing protein [Colwellia sp.]